MIKSKKENYIKELERNLEQQGKVIMDFGNKLRDYQKLPSNVIYEIRMKKYRDEIVALKKKIRRLEKCRTNQKGTIQS